MTHLDNAVVLAETGKHGPAVYGNMVLPFPVPSADSRQYGCLHPAQRVVSEPDRLTDGVAGVDPQEPVRPVAAVRRQKELVEPVARAEIRHAVQDSLVCQGGNPKTVAGLLAPQEAVDVTEQHLSLTGSVGRRNDGVAGVKHPGYHFQLEHRIDVGVPSGIRPHVPYGHERSGPQGEIVPFHPGIPGILRHCQREHVSESPCHHISVAGHITVLSFVRSQHSCYLFSHIGSVSQYRNHNYFFCASPYPA